MIIRCFKNVGKGPSKGPINYLLGKDKDGKERNPAPVILSGSKEAVAFLIDNNHRQHKYTIMPPTKPTLGQFAHLLEPEAKLQKYKIDVKNGIYEATDEADHLRMVQALGVIHRTPAPAQAPSTPVIQKSKKISEVISLYSEEKEKDNNKETIKDKKRTYQSLVDLFGNLEINLFSKQELVSWKSTQLKQDRRCCTNRPPGSGSLVR